MNHEIRVGDCLDLLREMEPGTVQTCITSPPYWGLRDYGHEGQLGLEPTPEEYVERLVGVFRDVRRVLREDGTLWLNLGDSYCGNPGGFQGLNGQRASRTFTARIDLPKFGDGLKPKDLVGIPWRVAFALQADGWFLRSDIIWAKPNPMPESVTDRPTKAHEYLFLLSKSPRYYYDAEAISEKAIHAGRILDYSGEQKANSADPEKQRTLPRGREITVGSVRNRRTVWTVPTQPFPGSHFAVMPPALVEPCVMAGSNLGDLVLDPFAGAATVGVVCRKHQRRFLGLEINPEYATMARGRLGEDVTADLDPDDAPLFTGVAL